MIDTEPALTPVTTGDTASGTTVDRTVEVQKSALLALAITMQEEDGLPPMLSEAHRTDTSKATQKILDFPKTSIDHPSTNRLAEDVGRA